MAGTDQGDAQRYLTVSVLVLGLGGGAMVALNYEEGNTSITKLEGKGLSMGPMVRMQGLCLVQFCVSEFQLKTKKTAKVNETSYELASVWLKQDLGHKKS